MFNIWKFQMIWGLVVTATQSTLFIIGLSLKTFSLTELILCICWLIWSSVATILFFKRKKEIEIEKEKNAMLFDNVLDIKILKKIPLKTIESYLRQEKLKNLQKEN